MVAEPGILTQARGLVAAFRQDGQRDGVLDELAATRPNLRSLAAHPSTSDELRERVLGVLLVVEVLASGAPQRVAV